jgi:hypothetical protein
LTNSDIIGHVQYYSVKTNSRSKISLLSPHKPEVIENEHKELRVKISESDMPVHDQITSPSVRAIDEGKTNSWTLAHHRIALASNPNLDVNISKEVWKKMTSVKGVITIPSESVGVRKRWKSRSLQITIKIPEEDDLEKPFTKEISPGTVTRFAEVVDEMSTFPETQRGQRRILSYRNAVSASGVPASFYDWAQFAKCSKVEFDGSFDTVDMKLFPEITPSPRPEKLEMDPTNDDNYYDAVLFATDDDYLSNAATRKIFNENALCKEDTKLFEMKEYFDQDEPLATDARNNAPVCSVM